MLSHGVEYGRKWKVFPTLAHTDVKHSNVERLSPERETHVWAIERLSIVHKESLQREASRHLESIHRTTYTSSHRASPPDGCFQDSFSWRPMSDLSET
jgi:hypothetical protein